MGQDKKVVALRLTAVIFLLVSLFHLLRLILKIDVMVGNFVLPMWSSVVGFLVMFTLAVWVLSLLKKNG